MTRPAMPALNPVQRAEIIYRAARAGLDQQLWQAALGRAEERKSVGSPLLQPAAPMSLDAVVRALSIEDRIAPVLTQSPPAEPVAQRSGALSLGPNALFGPALERAASRTGLDPALLASIVDAEAGRSGNGRWDPASRNPRSSAAGLGQFLESSWLAEARRPGSWLAAEAAARGWTQNDGSLRPGARPALLALRLDPEASIQAVADHAAANLRRLEAAGVPRGDVDDQARSAYLAHHLGLGDALRFLNGGLQDGRAGRLLAAQVGSASAQRRIAEAGGAAEAHRAWLLAYVDRRIRPSRFLEA